MVNIHMKSLNREVERLRPECLPKHFADIGGVPCRGCGSDHAHFLHVRGYTFSQQSLKQINIMS